MSDLYWHFSTDLTGKQPTEILRGLVDDDRKNYEKAESALQAEIAVLDKDWSYTSSYCRLLTSR